MDYLLFLAILVVFMTYLKNEEEEPGNDEIHLYYYRNDADFRDGEFGPGMQTLALLDNPLSLN